MNQLTLRALKATLVCLVASFLSITAQGQCSELFISEYVEGWSNNKALEIYNPTGSTVDLSDYRLERYSNGSTSAQDNQKVDLSGMLEPDSVVVVVLDKQDPDGVDFEAPVWDELAAAADLWLCPVYDENNTMYFNGNDAMVLRKISTNAVVDIFGKIGEDPGTTGWAEMTQNHTLIRKSNVLEGDTDALDEFLVVDEWDGILWFSDSTGTSLDSVFLNLGVHACDCGTAGLQSVAPSSNVKMFPNPASGEELWIQSPHSIDEVAVYNLAGQQMGHHAMRGQAIAQVPMAGYEAGMYLVEVIFENGTRSTQRVIRK